VGIITKSPLIERDLDLLQEIQRTARVSVSVSVRSGTASMPTPSSPTSRPPAADEDHRAVASAGLSVGVNVAPVIPGSQDADIRASWRRRRGRSAARRVRVLRLPGSVKQVFEQRLARDVAAAGGPGVLNRVARPARQALRFAFRNPGRGGWAIRRRDPRAVRATVKRLEMNEGLRPRCARIRSAAPGAAGSCRCCRGKTAPNPYGNIAS